MYAMDYTRAAERQFTGPIEWHESDLRLNGRRVSELGGNAIIVEVAPHEALQAERVARDVVAYF